MRQITEMPTRRQRKGKNVSHLFFRVLMFTRRTVYKGPCDWLKLSHILPQGGVLPSTRWWPFRGQRNVNATDIRHPQAETLGGIAFLPYFFPTINQTTVSRVGTTAESFCFGKKKRTISQPKMDTNIIKRK